MARNVLAVDLTVTYLSTCRVVEGVPVPLCGGKESPEQAKPGASIAADLRRHGAFAEALVNSALSSAHGAPELVVLVRPQIGYQGTRRARGSGPRVTQQTPDPSAARRLGLWWEVARQFAERGIPIAEVSILTVEKIVLGKAVWGAPGRDLLVSATQSAFPDLRLPQRNGEVDPRYRLTTVGAALITASHLGFAPAAAFGDASMMTADGRLTDAGARALALGATFPAGVLTPSALTRTAEKNRRAEIHDERLAEQIAEMLPADVEAMRMPSGPMAAAAYRKAVGSDV